VKETIIEPILPPTKPLPRSFYRRSPADVARDLLGQLLLTRLPIGTPVCPAADASPAEATKEDATVVCGGWIVETEAYLAAGDPASHSANGPTRRNAAMFADAGTLYVYSIHTHHCLNVVTEPEQVGSAVLIRAIEPVWGLETMCGRRRLEEGATRQLCRGPGRLTRALGIDKRHDQLDLCVPKTAWIAPWEHPRTIDRRESGRIGISKAETLPLRFFVDQNRFVSGRVAPHSAAPRQSLAGLPAR
jgi:DNA-3-methyladenine glycosylase